MEVCFSESYVSEDIKHLLLVNVSGRLHACSPPGTPCHQEANNLSSPCHIRPHSCAIRVEGARTCPLEWTVFHIQLSRDRFRRGAGARLVTQAWASWPGFHEKLGVGVVYVCRRVYSRCYEHA